MARHRSISVRAIVAAAVARAAAMVSARSTTTSRNLQVIRTVTGKYYRGRRDCCGVGGSRCGDTTITVSDEVPKLRVRR